MENIEGRMMFDQAKTRCSGDEPSSSLALYFRICAYFESRVTFPVTVSCSRLRYCSAEVILWLSACSFFYFSCYFAFSLISLFVTHFLASHEMSHTERCVSPTFAYSRQVSADFGYISGYFCFFLLFDIFAFYSFSLRLGLHFQLIIFYFAYTLSASAIA